MNKVICELLGHFLWLLIAELTPIYAVISMVNAGHYNLMIGVGGLIAVLWIFGGIYHTMKNIHKSISELKKLREAKQK